MYYISINQYYNNTYLTQKSNISCMYVNLQAKSAYYRYVYIINGINLRYLYDLTKVILNIKTIVYPKVNENNAL